MSKFTLPKICYNYSALDKYIDTETMELHHTKHHQTYINTLNSEIDKHDIYKENDLRYILQNVLEDEKDMEKNFKKLRDNAGGHYNHSLFWLMMNPNSNTDNISGKLRKQIECDFGDLNTLISQFSDLALQVFGSGWAWLCYDFKDQKLVITVTANQDNPIMHHKNLLPFLGLDVWEHAYYLRYRNLRKNYIENWWNTVDWKNVSYFYENFILKGETIVVFDDGTVNMC